jgi:hypothetical protein
LGLIEHDGRAAVKYALFILSVLSLFTAWGILMKATSAIHEIEGFIFYLITAVLFVGAAVVDALNKLERPAQQLASSPIPTETKPPFKLTAEHKFYIGVLIAMVLIVLIFKR